VGLHATILLATVSSSRSRAQHIAVHNKADEGKTIWTEGLMEEQRNTPRSGKTLVKMETGTCLISTYRKLKKQ
jgi:hypothetical protein